MRRSRSRLQRLLDLRLRTDRRARRAQLFARWQLRKDLSPYLDGIDVFAFVDHGAVDSTAPARIGLTAVGAGFRLFLQDRVSLDFTGGFPVGDKIPGHPDFALFGQVIVKAF